jgi:predicted branched-subunit amino acid permease
LTASPPQAAGTPSIAPLNVDAPGWVAGATQTRALLRGLRVAFSTPGLVLFFTSIGFGGLARDLGFTFGHALFMSSVFYALPAQVVLIDQLARGAALTAAAFAVSLTAVRLLPMTITLLPLIRDARGFRPVHLIAGHIMAITVWLEGSRRLPLLPEHLRLAHFFGIGGGMFLATCSGTVVGYLVSGVLPPVLLAALLFMTPVYFLLSLGVGARSRMDWLAIALGVTLGPLLFYVVPGPDLMLTGLVGGTLAYLVGRGLR